MIRLGEHCKSCQEHYKRHLHSLRGIEPNEENTGGKELVITAIYRFVTNFLMLQSLLPQAKNLKKMFLSNERNCILVELQT